MAKISRKIVLITLKRTMGTFFVTLVGAFIIPSNMRAEDRVNDKIGLT